MDIIITVSDSELTTADKRLIKNCLGLRNDAELGEALKKLGKTAFMEYLKMLKEKGLPTRADEVQQERLFFLINYYFSPHLPEESQIASIFQLTPSESKTLLRNTKSRYRTKINTYINTTLKERLESAVDSEDGTAKEFICVSPSTIEELNAIVSQKGPELALIHRMRNLANKYSCAQDTYNLLMDELN